MKYIFWIFALLLTITLSFIAYSEQPIPLLATQPELLISINTKGEVLVKGKIVAKDDDIAKLAKQAEAMKKKQDGTKK